MRKINGKWLFMIGILAALGFVISGCSFGSRQDMEVSGSVGKKTVEWQAGELTVENIYVKTGAMSSGPQIELLSDGGTARAEIEAQDGLLNAIVVKTNNGSLRIYAASDRTYITTSPVTIRLYNYQFEKLRFSGACQVTDRVGLGSPEKDLEITMVGACSLKSPLLQAGKLTADIGGASTLTAEQMRTDRFKLDLSGASTLSCKDCEVTTKSDWSLSGASTLTLAGKGNELFAVLNGASTVKSFDFEQQTCVITVSGSSTMELNVVQSLGGSILRSSTVYYKGDPETMTEVGSTGKLEKK